MAADPASPKWELRTPATPFTNTTSVYPVNTSFACSGTLVTNSDGTKSCVTQVGTSVNGYPIYQVTNLNTGITSYVEQTGISSTGQPVYSVTPYFPTSSLAPAPAPVTAAPVTAAPVTAAPVTAAPVTAAPVTLAPAPVTAAPAPVTAAPVPNPFVY
ncbi:hypothetical protein GHT06_020731 [Daphnia sinensis]|uniref:Uncharacterized protein n=1 Tax=Daphnia sinensis TaxID=1820382 RepID=A0AAD5KZE4_9CRUS|nr:hypothetical protein GHT06_020731 [Daphnia sinensis]